MIELTELIGSIRRDLDEAKQAGENENLRFEVGPIELELSITASKTGKAGVKVYVVDLHGEKEHQATQRIKFTVTPLDSTTRAKPQIGDLDPDANL